MLDGSMISLWNRTDRDDWAKRNLMQRSKNWGRGKRRSSMWILQLCGYCFGLCARACLCVCVVVDRHIAYTYFPRAHAPIQEKIKVDL